MKKEQKIPWGNIYLTFGGFFLGLITAGLLVYMLMPGMMINVHESTYSFWGNIYLTFGGFFLGLITAGLLVYKLMPGMMINVHKSKYSFDETVSKLTIAIEENSWKLSGTRDMQNSLKKSGVDFPYRVTLLEICQPDYANEILLDDTHLATLMPCALAVYEGKDGKIYISGMNTGLMGKMFGGTVAEVMGKKVSKDEKVILSSVIK